MSIHKSFVRLAAGLFLTFSMAMTAAAQSNILVVDRAKVFNDSEVGKHVARQLETIATTMNSELDSQELSVKSTAQALNNDVKSLQAQLQGKSQQEVMQTVSARPDLEQKYKDYISGVKKVQGESQIKKIELEITQQKAMMEVMKKMNAIIDTVAVERGASVVLDKSNVIYTSPSVDITSTVLSRLNSQATRIPVTRERLPRKQPGQ